MRLILPILGFEFLDQQTQQRPTDEETEPQGARFTIRSSELDAKMIQTDDGYVVLKGSQGAKSVSQSISDGWKRLRERLLASGTLKESDDRLVFTSDYGFSSVSAAAAIVLGRQASGPLEWRTEDGQTYKDFTAEQVSKSSKMLST